MIADWLPSHVARIRASIHTKLLAAFLVIVALMLASAFVGLRALSEVNRRAEDMVQLQRKIAAYRQLNHDTVAQLYSVASSLLKPEERALQATLRQLNQFGYDLDRIGHGISETLTPVFVAFGFLAAAWLCIAAGMRRPDA